MGILSGYKKFKKYLRTADGYQLCSEWTKADSVEMADGSTLQESVSSLNEEVASLNEDITSLNGNLVDSLGGITFGVDADGNYGYIKAGADTVTPFKKETKLPNIVVSSQQKVLYSDSDYSSTIYVNVPAGYNKMTLSGATGVVNMSYNGVGWSAVTGNGTYIIPANTSSISCRLKNPYGSNNYSITLSAG